jgi:DNA-binding NtrC family response regulator
MASVSRVAKTDASVLIIGETGSGKEVVSRAIHDNSTRSGGPLEIVDCGSVLPTLLASELFGHEKGAFTGAERQHVGAFERANGGTIFLDEIGELPLQLQSALLGALERRSFKRLGGKDVVEVDVRLISATNRDLRGAVNAKTFRQDLYYRLAVVPLPLPALRERKEDIPMLARHFVELSGYQGDPSEILTAEVLASFDEHDWPDNVRELRNAIEAVLAVGNVATLRSERAPSVAAGGADPFESLTELPYHDARDALLEQFEPTYLRRLLARSDGNVSEAARTSGMNRTYLTRLIKKRGLRVKRVAEEID